VNKKIWLLSKNILKRGRKVGDEQRNNLSISLQVVFIHQAKLEVLRHSEEQTVCSINKDFSK
jgi:hypothetical protein